MGKKKIAITNYLHLHKGLKAACFSYYFSMLDALANFGNINLESKLYIYMQ